MNSEVIKQGPSLVKAGVFVQQLGEYIVACDIREDDWISIHEDDAQSATFDELEEYYSQVPLLGGESPQELAYRAAEVRATWDEETDERRRRSESFFGKTNK